MTWVALIGLAILTNGRYVLGWLPVPEGANLISGVIPTYGSALVASILRPSRVRFPKGTLVTVGLNLALAALMGLSLFWTPAPRYGLLKTQAFVMLACIPSIIFVVGSNWVTRVKNAHVFMKSLLMLGIIYATAVIVVGASTSTNRVVAWDFNAIRGSQYMAVSGLVCMSYLVTERRMWRRFLWSIAIMILLIGLGLSGSRGPVLAAILPSALVLALRHNSLDRGRSVRVSLSVWLLVLCLIGIILFAAVQQQEQLILLSRLSPSYMAQDDNVSGRIERWRSATAMLDVANLLVGPGIGSFAYYWDGFDTRSYPHNIVAEMLELGLVGTVLFLLQMVWFFGSGLFRVVSNWSVRFRCASFHPFIVFLSLAMFLFFNAMFTGDLVQNSVIWVFAMLSVLFGANVAKEARMLVGR